MSMGNSPESLSQAMLVGTMLVGGLDVLLCLFIVIRSARTYRKVRRPTIIMSGYYHYCCLVIIIISSSSSRVIISNIKINITIVHNNVNTTCM